MSQVRATPGSAVFGLKKAYSEATLQMLLLWGKYFNRCRELTDVRGYFV